MISVDNKIFYLLISTDNKTSDNYDDLGCNDGCPFQSRDADNLTEEILRKIEGLQLRIRIIKARMDKMVNENPQKFSSINILSSRVPSSAILINSGNHPYDEKEDRTIMQCSTSQHASEVNMWDNFIPESAVSGDSEVASPRDMLRTMSQRLLEISSENVSFFVDIIFSALLYYFVDTLQLCNHQSSHLPAKSTSVVVALA